MTFVEWLPIAFVCLLGAATPGPSLAVIISQTVENGISAGRFASIAHATAVGIYALGAIVGLHTLFITVPALNLILTTVGSLYLIYLGIVILSAARQPKVKNSEPKKTNITGIKQAFLIAFLNPKLAVFFFALFSQFIPSSGVSVWLATILVSTVLLIDMLWYLIMVQIVFTVHNQTQISRRTATILHQIQGVTFILIAIYALTTIR